MRTAFALCAILLAVGLSGCFQTPGSTLEAADEPFTISRQVRVHVDDGNIDRLMQVVDDPRLIDRFRYDFLDPQLVIRVGRDVDPKQVTLTYVDRDGVAQTQPLALLQGASVLRTGDTLSVPVHMFSGGQLKGVDGKVLADRTTKGASWFQVGGYPIGVSMAPGAELTYALGTAVTQTFSLTDVHPLEEPYHVEALRARVQVRNDATMRLAYDRASETVTANERHQARPLHVDVEGTLSLPIEISLNAMNTTSRQTIDAGFEILPGSTFSYAGAGKLYWNDSREPVKLELDGGTASGQLDVIAWLTGAPELEEDFSCAGRSRIQQCRPTELDTAEIGRERTLGASTHDLDGWTSVVDPAIVADLQQFLADDLRAGDAVTYDLDIDGKRLPGYAAGNGYPERIGIEGTTRVLGGERISVAAGTFDTYKLSQMLRVRLQTSEYRSPGGMTFEAIEVDEKLYEGSVWLDNASFVVVKAHSTSPFDFGRVWDDVLDALDPRLWENAPISRLTSANVDVALTGTSTMELTSLKGDARFAPWLFIGGAPLFLLAQEGLPDWVLGQEFGRGADEWSEY